MFVRNKMLNNLDDKNAILAGVIEFFLIKCKRILSITSTSDSLFCSYMTQIAKMKNLPIKFESKEKVWFSWSYFLTRW